LDLNSNNIEKLFFDTVLNYSYLLPLIFLLIFFRKTRLSAFVWIFASYFLLYFLMNFFYRDIKHEIGKKPYYFLYTFIEFLVFAYLFWKFIANKKFKLLIIICSIAFITFLIIFFSTLHSIRTIDTVPIGVETLLMFVFIFYYFYQYFRHTNTSILSDYSFWIITGILVYLGSTFFFNILADSIAEAEFEKYWYLTYIGDIMKNILCAVAIIVYIKHPDTPKDQKQASIPYLDMI